MKSLLQLILLQTVVGIMSAGCSDSDEKTTEYKLPKGVYVSTPEILFNKSTYKDFAFNLTFYSNDSVFPIPDLANSTVLIYPVSKPELYLQSVRDHSPMKALCLYHEYFFSWENNSKYNVLPNFEEIDHAFELYYYFPGEGQYDFYLKFIMFDGYSYTSPVYRLTISEDLERKEFYSTNITTLNND